MKIERERRCDGRTVLVIVPEYHSEYYGRTLSCLFHALQARGLDMVSATTEFARDYEGIHRIVRSLRGICGIIVSDIESPLEIRHLPVIHIGSYIPSISGHSWVSIDFVSGIRDKIEYLLSKKRRRIAYIGERNTGSKTQAFRCLIREYVPDYDERYVCISGFRFAQAGADGFSTLFSLPEPPDAILCSYDYIALGVLNAADAAGIDVPDELAVIGSDDVRAAGAYRLGLSTMDVDHDQYAELITEMLLRSINDPTAPPRRISISQKLIIRQTS